MGSIVLDASVIIAVFDPLDMHHLPALSAIQRVHADGDRFLVPASVLAEVLMGEARRNDGVVEHRTAAVNRLFGACRVIDEEVAITAARLRARHRALRLPDALVIATAVVDGATSILTADKRWAGIDPRVEVL